MELRHLRYFIMVAEELHFGRAAEKLGIAQPPLSQQIKALEQEIGVLLLLRTKQRVQLSPAGVIFLNEARKIMAQADLAKRVAQRAARGEIGQLRVGFINSVIYDKIPYVFKLMRTRYPDISLVLQELTTEEQVEAVLAYKLDVGLVRTPIITRESLISNVIWREPLVVVLPRSHRLARYKKISIEALAGEPFLQIPRHLAPGFYDQFIRICSEAGFSPRIVQEARTTPTIVSLVAVGMGVSIVPAYMQRMRQSGAVYRPFDPPVVTTDLAVIRRSEDETPALHRFLEIISEVAELKSKI